MKMSELPLPQGVELHDGPSPEQTAEALADDVAKVLRRRLKHARNATLVVSGGSTPVPFFQALSGKTLDWGRVVVVLADERWVPDTHPDSNAALLRAHLLQDCAACAQFLQMEVGEGDPETALPAIERQLAPLALPVDVLVLGMGNDGHTASLFPDAPELAQAMAADNECRVALMTPPSQSRKRITLTPPVLAGARFTALHLKGQEKLDTLATALADLDDPMAMPIRAFLKPGLEIYWSP
ncbi:6-phosphogluconolactonase [Marinobacter oulmenensis]|uniref:6-phosphogluconolactonase n=1 Tax=Marinobacter oulmenensis TaxID=643747 RepID=A0A840U9J0_9GAMM|nr:6-phosphogluconolactonase [Marinobacter oulmenensis]MBB5322404.1 6-phosphogluconolactonase [Marinobacter oulmenensis]